MLIAPSVTRMRENANDSNLPTADITNMGTWVICENSTLPAILGTDAAMGKQRERNVLMGRLAFMATAASNA
ncbi:hypothetical protein Bang102_005205 [Bifidobacterium angulatum]|nr:hypothetical protein Bang102_005205 [Bifidobacterium angulatum]